MLPEFPPIFLFINLTTSSGVLPVRTLNKRLFSYTLIEENNTINYIHYII